jgi:hypothetical protein
MKEYIEAHRLDGKEDEPGIISRLEEIKETETPAEVEK